MGTGVAHFARAASMHQKIGSHRVIVELPTLYAAAASQRSPITPGCCYPWQVQAMLDEGVAMIRNVKRQTPDLAVSDLSGQVCVLPAHSARGLAPFGKTGLVNHDDRIE